MVSGGVRRLVTWVRLGVVGLFFGSMLLVPAWLFFLTSDDPDLTTVLVIANSMALISIWGPRVWLECYREWLPRRARIHGDIQRPAAWTGLVLIGLWFGFLLLVPPVALMSFPFGDLRSVEIVLAITCMLTVGIAGPWAWRQYYQEWLAG